MKKVWQCEYCINTDVDKNVIKKHEINCSFNPLNKSCNTCENNDVEYWNGVGNSFCKLNHQSNFGMEDGECSDWIIKLS